MDQASLLLGSELDRGVGQTQGPANVIDDDGAVGTADFKFEEVSQQAVPVIGVGGFPPRRVTGREVQPHRGQVLIQVCLMIVKVRVGFVPARSRSPWIRALCSRVAVASASLILS
jgi:hypothetical protein